MEANIKVVHHGNGLHFLAKVVHLQGADLSTEQVQRLCSVLGKTHDIAAVACKTDGIHQLLIHAHESIPERNITVDTWVIRIVPAEETVRLELRHAQHRQLIADLYKRRLVIEANRKINTWTLDSPRILYDKSPFMSSRNKDGSRGDVDVYRRYEVADVVLEEAGLGIAVNLSTAFITNWSVEDYFSQQYQDRFYKLTARQKDHEGTMIYAGPKGKLKCYFRKYCPDLTLETAPPIDIAGKKYRNPYEYYRKNYPSFPVQPQERVALVSFPGVGLEAYVPARCLFVRVANEMLDPELSQIDKIAPPEREQLVSHFWERLGARPFGPLYAGVKPGFYVPSSASCGRVPLLPLLFGGGHTLSPPEYASKETYRKHYRSRKQMLDRHGCYYVPPTMHRNLYFVLPVEVGEEVAGQVAKAICDKVSRLTRIEVEPVLLSYEQYYDALVRLRTEYDPEMAVFVFDDRDPVVYFNIRHELTQWKIKRITVSELQRKLKALALCRAGKNTNGEKSWQAFIDMNAYDIVQQLGCIPFLVVPKLNYHAQLVIDVAPNGSHLAFSLFVYKEGMRYPVADTLVKPKTDKKAETINAAFIEKYVTELFTKHKAVFQKYKVETLLALRDGRDCQEEFASLQKTIHGLRGKVLPVDFAFHFAEYHKNSQKGIRLWERLKTGVDNVLEGTYALLDAHVAVLTPTGSGTLHQGTADPVVLHRKHTDCDLRKVVEDVFWVSQMNYGNPSIAQRLTLPAKRADDLLLDRRAQEILRVK